jgi:hypothetical protein
MEKKQINLLLLDIKQIYFTPLQEIRTTVRLHAAGFALPTGGHMNQSILKKFQAECAQTEHTKQQAGS